MSRSREHRRLQSRGGAVTRWVRVGLVIAVFVALGCGETANGPTTTEFNKQRAAQEARVAAREKQQKHGGAPAARKVAQAGNPGAEGGFGVVDRDFVYDPTGKRDPFRAFKWTQADRNRNREALGPLEQFDLSQLSLVAVVWETGNARALIQDPSGGTYIVAKGARVGKNEGKITAIGDNMVRVKETYVDFLGRETTKDIELRMRGNEGG